MQLDVPTIAFASAAITAAVALAMLFYSLARKENRIFFWVAAAVGCFALALFLTSFRGIIPDFYSVILSNELGAITLATFYEGYRRLLGVRPWERFVGPVVLVLQLILFIWFTEYQPSFVNRVVIVDSVFVIMSACIMKLLVKTSLKNHRRFHVFAALPFAIAGLGSLIHIGDILIGHGLSAGSLASPNYAVTMMRFGIMGPWMSLSIFFIVTDRLQIRIREMALTDPLTGLLNRRALRDAAGREMSRARRNGLPVALIITDLDLFKSINDRFGHQAGDAVLAQTAKIFQTTLRKEDLLARYGGEEFVAILPGVAAPEALLAAERLRQACEEAVLRYDQVEVTVTCSFGVSAYEGGSLEFDDLLRHADEALYLAKKRGRNRTVASIVEGADPEARSEAVIH